MRKTVFLAVLCWSCLATLAVQADSADSLWLEDLTWPEVAERIAAGQRSVLIPTGGTEQNGPHMVLGKHNYIVRWTAGEIARRLGDALVAPVIAYVPEGRIDPPQGHMRFPGTLSLPEPVFAALLEHSARSLKAHGFTAILLLGDSGGNQRAQEKVAAKLSAEWAADGVRVVQVSDYYAANGQTAWLIGEGETEATIGSHAGIRDTSELMAVHPGGIREDRRAATHAMATGATAAPASGVSGDPARASAARGRRLLELKIDAALAQIRAALADS